MIDHEVMRNAVSFWVVVAKAGVVQPKSWELSALGAPVSDVSAGRQLQCVAFGFPLLVELKALSMSFCGETGFRKYPNYFPL